MRKIPLVLIKLTKTNPSEELLSRGFYYLFVLTRRSSAEEREETSASISSRVLYSLRLIRSEQSASCAESPKAISASLGFAECEEQAEPLDTNIPSADKK